MILIKENYCGGKLVKIIGDERLGKNCVCSFADMFKGERLPFGIYKLGTAFGIHDLNIEYLYFKIDENSYLAS